jgi:hypothetical protein
MGPIDFNRALAVSPGFNLDFPPLASTPVNNPSRIQLFRIVPGFLRDPVSIDPEDGLLLDPKAITNPWPSWWNSPEPKTDGDSSSDWLNLALGNHNPFFDLRQPGDPGGVGYFQVATQVQLLDLPSTACAFAVQAYAPAGQYWMGVANGPTIFAPALSVFHDLGGGTAIQGYVSKNMLADPRQIGGSQLHQNLRYGLALQHPILPASMTDGSNNVYVFVETLGRYQYGSTTNPVPGPIAAWELLPGLQWRLNTNMWLSSGVVFPVGQTRFYENNHLQFTCSFQF